MAYTFSTDQLSIINARNQNILVSAAAGSGKTSVLTERIVRLVSDPDRPVDIDRILVVTFTNAAAKEMKERIGARLNAMLEENPQNEHLQRQSQLIYNAQITTIDSYCLNLVKNHFHKIGVDPVFRVAAETEMKLLKQDVMRDVIKNAYETKDPEFYHIVDCYSKKDNDDTLENGILALYTYAMSYPDPKGWLKKCRSYYAFDSVEEFKNSFYMQEAVKTIREKIAEIEKKLITADEMTSDETGAYYYNKTAKEDMELLRPLFQVAAGGDFDAIYATACQIPSYGKLAKAPSGAANSEEALEFKALREDYKDLVTKLKETYLFQSADDAYLDMAASRRVINKITELVEIFMDSFDAAKRELGVIDFPDMEHMAIKILIKDFHEDGTYEITDVARDLRDYYAEVMVDEYQDSNLVQEILIQSVSRENSENGRNRFMVGDIKQSIYRFRLARPNIFADKTVRYSQDEKSPDRLITLKQNYRSRDCVINSVNAIFKDIMTAEQGGIVYDDDAKLTRAGTFAFEDAEDNITDVILIDKEGANKADSSPVIMDALAATIKDIVGKTKVIDKKTGEAVTARYKDVAVLFRSVTGWRKYIKDSFEKYGIPYHMEGTGTFYDTREIRDILSFLTVINNPLDDISLYASMTSCFGDFNDEECARIKGEDGGNHYYLWDKLKAYADKHPEDNKVSRFIELVARYRKLVTYMPISELIENLFEESGYKYIVAALPDGEQRLANVNLLSLKASEYAKTSFHGLFHFLRYVELIKKSEQEEGEANIFDENADVVKVMSIHKSKGLEFPVCIVAGVDSAFNDKDYSKPFVSDIDYGIGIDFIDPKLRTKRTTVAREAIKDHMRKENLGEEIRILYVALTRAKEKLIIMGGVSKADNWLDGGKGESNTNSYLGLISKTVLSRPDLFNLVVRNGAEFETAQITKQTERIITRDEFLAKASLDNEEFYKKISDRFSYVYPYDSLKRLYTKTSVSDLKLAHIEEEEAVQPFVENEPHEYVPAFIEGEQEVKGTARGTAYHNLLMNIDFKAMLAAEDKKAEYEREKQEVVYKGRMSAEDVALVNTGKMTAFLESDLAKRMGAAAGNGLLFKEQPFVIGIKASELDEEFPETETVLIQGIIDAFFIENDEIVLLDYKTDRVETADELVNRYKLQLDYYATALARIMGMNVKEKLIYSLRLNQSIKLD